MMSRYIDLNADLGERPDATEQDAALLEQVTSANVACGGHAGDAHTMRRIVELAKKLGVAVGAHPSFPDRENFGRDHMSMVAADLERSVREQIEALVEVARSVDVRVVHVKPHGALYHAANHDAEVARSIAGAVLAVDPAMIVVGQAGSQVESVYREMGLRTAAEAFADRAYEADGKLRNRKLPGALLNDPSVAARQALAIATEGKVIAGDGQELAMNAETLCIHSDTPNSVEIAREIRSVLTRAGIQFRSLAR